MSPCSQPFFPTKKHTYPLIRARVYQALRAHPTFINVITQDDGNRRFPYLQGLLDPESNNLQPYIHFCKVRIFDGRRDNTFYFCFKNHIRLPKNKTVRSLSGAIWNGDIIIMRVGVDHQRVVNMRGCDAKLADFILKKCVQAIRQGRHLFIPKNLHFTKRV